MKVLFKIYIKNTIIYSNVYLGNTTTRLEECRKNIFKVLTQLPDIVENVNKEVETIVKSQIDHMIGSCSIDLIDEKEEVHECIEGSKKRKAEVQIQQRYNKLRRWSDHIDEDDLEDLDNEFDALLSDWDWSDSEEWENEGDKILEVSVNDHQKLLENYYDDMETDPNWNDFNFWKMELDFRILEDDFKRKDLEISIGYEDLIAHDDPDAQDLIMEYNPVNTDTDWTKWKFWNNFGSTLEILKANEVICDIDSFENKVKDFHNKNAAYKKSINIQNFKAKRWQRYELNKWKRSMMYEQMAKPMQSKRKLLMKIYPKQPKKQMKFSSFCGSV